MGALTPNLGLTVPTVGGDTGPLYAQEINGDLTLLDSCLGGVNSLNVGGNVNVTLNTSQSQNLIQLFTGTLTGSITVYLPATGRFYAIENATTGAFGLSVGCAGGGNVQQIPQGLSVWVWTDGTYTRLSNPPGWQEIATYVVSGAATQTILLPGPFRRFKFTLQNMTPNAANSYLTVSGSINGGSSFVATGYSFANYVFTSAGGSNVGGGPNPQSGIIITSGNQVGVAFDGSYEIGPFATGFWLKGLVTSVTASGATYTEVVGGAAGSLGGLVNAIAIGSSAGTFSGTIIVEGLP